MISRTPIIFVIGILSLLVAQAASAQPRWGRERLPQVGACFYENIDYGGRYFCVAPGEALRSLPAGMGDRVSSVRLVGAAEVTVFRDQDMRGRSARFTTDVRDLRRGGWNDQISSIDVAGGFGGGRDGRPGDRGDRGRDDRGRDERVPVWGRTERMPSAGACFYEDAGFRGQYFCIARGATYTALPRGFNDRISSIRVLGGSRVEIFKDSNFRGRSRQVRNDQRDLRGKWKDDVSSIRVF